MRTPQLSLNRTDQGANLFASEKESPRKRRALVAGALLFLATVAALVAGGWGVLASLNAEAPPARIGQGVAVPGGSLRVDAVLPEHMAPMQSQKFAASGMSMSSMGMDMAPEGYRRFAVDVTLSADEGGELGYSPQDFQISGEGMKKEVGPIRHQLDGQTIPPGSSIAGNLVFQVPEKASELRLIFDGGQPVALDLEPAIGDHSHGGHRGGHDH